MRSYGEVTYTGGYWKVKAEPHILLRLKAVFPRLCKTDRGTVTMKHTEEVCRDLEWFLTRYQLDVDAETKKFLGKSSRKHRETILRLEDMLDPNYKPRVFSLAVPARMYQQCAAELFLSRRSLLLGDDVGIGKTATALCALTDPKTLPAVVVTLSGTMPRQWEEECQKFLPSASVHVLRKGTPYELPKFMGRGPDIVILNYHKLAKWADVLAAYANSVIFDECQELRRTASQKYSAASSVAGATRFRLGMSATPIYNYGSEIWNVLDVLRPGALGDYHEFLREWCSSYGRHHKIDEPKAFGAYLRENFLLLRRTRSEVGRELPALTKIPHTIDTEKEPLEEVKEAADELANIILADGELKRGDRMRAAGELDWKLRHATGVAKAPHVADFVRLLVESGENVLVYAWHRTVYDILMKRLEDYKPAMFTGQESERQKLASRRRFIDGDTRILFMSLRAGAGVDGLQKNCRTVVFAELDWSPGVHEQCTGRIFRDGQPDPVTVYYLVAEEGSDPVVAETLGVKREQVEGIKDPKRELVTELQATSDRAASLAKHYLAKMGKTRRRAGRRRPEEKIAVEA